MHQFHRSLVGLGMFTKIGSRSIHDGGCESKAWRIGDFDYPINFMRKVYHMLSSGEQFGMIITFE